MNNIANSRIYDNKDIQIARVIDEHIGSKISTKNISDKLDIPARSIRYRINRMKESAILQEKTIIAHERKLGIREHFFIVEEVPKNTSKLLAIINNNSSFDWYVPTIGKYNGYLIHAINCMDVPDYPLILMKKMKEKEIISDFYGFELVDYQELGWNYDYFNSDSDWTWNWGIWFKQIKEKNKHKKKELSFEENPELTSFDYLDIQILKHLYLSNNITQKELANILELSESQISRRIKTLEKSGIIRGYRTGFNPFRNTITILCVIKSNGSLEEIIQLLNQIPYPRTIAFENEKTLGFGIKTPTDEVNAFLNGLHLLGSKTDSYLVQIYLKEPIYDPKKVFDLFDKDTNDWRYLAKQFENSFKNLK